MILPGNASLILSVAQQLIKLGRRVDNLFAERTATQSAIILKMPAVLLVDLEGQMTMVRATLKNTAALQPDPFGSDRPSLNTEVNPGPPTLAFGPLFKKYFPDTGLLVDPDADFLAELKNAFPGLDWKDPAVRVAAFALTPGPDGRQLGYNARLALTVADTLLEFGAEHTALVVRDAKLRALVQTVLQRLAQPDWGAFDQWSPLLQTALKATLNAALDVGEKLPGENPWLAGLLDALAQARASAAKPDDFLLGLLEGKGVRLLLAKGVLVAGDKLSDAQSDAFKLIAADVLRATVPFIENAASPDLGQFFNDHWGDLLRAGLSSLDRHGDLLLDQTNPLLAKTLKALVLQLSTTPNARFLTHETLFRLADTAIAIVADNPAELAGLETKPWLRDLLAAAAKTARQLTVEKLFTPAAAEALVLDAIAVLAKNPGLIVAQKGLPLALATDIFTAVSQLKRLDARTVGETALRAALAAIAADPALAAGKFGPAIAAVTTQLAGWIGQKKITADQAAALAMAAINATARNPKIFAELQKNIAGAVLTAVQQTLPNTPVTPWASRMLVQLARETLFAVARSGSAVATKQTAVQFQKLLTDVLDSGLKLAAAELGQSVDLNGIPLVVAGLVERALHGDLTVFDPASPEFSVAFKALAATVAART